DFTCVTSACNPPPPGALTVKIDPAELAKRSAVDVAEFKLKEQEESDRKAAEASKIEAAKRAAEVRKQQEESERMRRESDAKQAEEAEKLRREADAKKVSEEQELQKKRSEVNDWLKKQGFKDITVPKKTRSCLVTSVQYPLHKAAADGNARLVQLLLELNADPKLKNSKGKTALEVARKTKMPTSKEVVALLEGAAKRT
ncbi:unnamed protein product, partial [Symbiodinium pilosum]